MTPANYDISILRGVEFSGFVITAKDNTGTMVNLTGWSAFAQARDTAGHLLVDFAPTISDPVNGIVTIPPINAAATRAMSLKTGRWDLLLQRPTGERLGPFVAGTLTIADQPTQNP